MSIHSVTPDSSVKKMELSPEGGSTKMRLLKPMIELLGTIISLTTLVLLILRAPFILSGPVPLVGILLCTLVITSIAQGKSESVDKLASQIFISMITSAITKGISVTV